jgi:hypothetical protein
MASDKGIYGMISGIITTSILQPFENIKMALMLPPKDLKLNNNVIKNVSLSYSYIKKVDGWKGFYKGLSAATLKAALGCYIYFSCLRYLEKENKTRMQNFVISSISRIASSLLTNPLNLI